METKIDNFEMKFININKNIQKYEEKQNNLEFFSKDKELQEISPKIGQKDFSQSNSSLPTERKTSYDSESICPSQAETLSQTSESSFFFSYANANSQLLTVNEIIQIEKKTEKEISFFHGAEEYFYQLMPEKFTEYTNTKNYIHKKNYFKKNSISNYGIKNRMQNIINEDIPMANYFYFPVIYYPYPINSFYFNSFSNININNYNNNQTQKEVNKEIPKDKNSDEKEIEINLQKEETKEEKSNESKEEEAKKKEVEEQDQKVDEKDQKSDEKEQKEGEKVENIEILYSKRKQKYYKNQNKFNNWNNQDYNYKKSSNKNQRYYQNYNRQYNNNNKYTNYYYDNENFQDGIYNNYYNNNYHKRRYQKPFENKLFSYK